MLVFENSLEEKMYFQNLRDQWALKFPYPATRTLEYQIMADRSKNPHNESHKPKLRNEAEIVSDLAYAFADQVLTQRHGKQYQSFLKVEEVRRAW